MTHQDVSAVVVAWDAGASLAACVDALRSSAQRAEIALQLVVVDNASTDDAVSALRLGDPDVVIRNPVNAGYGVAAAQGIARASGAWVLLVNPDVVVDDGFFTALADPIRQAPQRVATLVPEMRFVSRPDVVNCRGLTVDEIGVPAEIDSGTTSPPGAAPSRPVLGGSSGCCLLRTSTLHAIGGPEPVFFAYLEDADLALRLNRLGLTAQYVPEARAAHEGSAAAGAHSPLKAFLVARNRRLLFRLQGPHTLRARLGRVPVELGHGLWTMRGTGAAPWGGRLDAIRLRRYVEFVRRGRTRAGETAAPELSRRATLSETLSRKRRIDHVHGER